MDKEGLTKAGSSPAEATENTNWVDDWVSGATRMGFHHNQVPGIRAGYLRDTQVECSGYSSGGGKWSKECRSLRPTANPTG